MSLVGFDTLLAQHTDLQPAIRQLENQIAATVSLDPAAVIDDRILSQQLHTKLEVVHELLVELVALFALDTRLFWLCPNGKGTVLEEPAIADFPLVIECDRCGQEHQFKRDDVDVRFVPSEQLLKSLREFGR